MKPFLSSVLVLCSFQLNVLAADKTEVQAKITTLTSAVSRNTVSSDNLDRIVGYLDSAIQIANQTSGGDPASCYSKAYNHLYDQDKAQELCSGGGTLQTVECYFI